MNKFENNLCYFAVIIQEALFSSVCNDELSDEEIFVTDDELHDVEKNNAIKLS